MCCLISLPRRELILASTNFQEPLSIFSGLLKDMFAVLSMSLEHVLAASKSALHSRGPLVYTPVVSLVGLAHQNFLRDDTCAADITHAVSIEAHAICKVTQATAVTDGFTKTIFRLLGELVFWLLFETLFPPSVSMLVPKNLFPAFKVTGPQSDEKSVGAQIRECMAVCGRSFWVQLEHELFGRDS
jgi:hypothetical protein